MKVENAEKSFLSSLKGTVIRIHHVFPFFLNDLNTNFPDWNVFGLKAVLASVLMSY